MVIEELIAKLGFRVGSLNEAKRFLRMLDDLKKATKGAGQGLKVNFGGGSSGLGRSTREFERATAAIKRYRQEAERAARVRMPGHGPGGPGGYNLPRVGPGGYRPGMGAGLAAGAAAGRIGRFGAGSAAGAAVAIAPPILAVKKFATLESAAVELGITAEQARERV